MILPIIYPYLVLVVNRLVDSIGFDMILIRYKESGGRGMNVQVTATLIAAGTELISELIRNRKTSSENAPPDISTLLNIPERKEYNKTQLLEAPAVATNVKVKVVEDEQQPDEPPYFAHKKDGTLVRSMTKPKKVAKEVVIASESMEDDEVTKSPEVNEATAIPTGCIPCSLGHVGTCSGLLNEATRFARGPNGVQAPEVLDRVNMCLDELNALEREDLRPAKVTKLSGWERDLAEKVLNTSRTTRHKLEDVSNINPRGLEEIAASTQNMRQEIGREWFRNKLANLTPDDQKRITEKVMEKLTTMRDQMEQDASGKTAESTATT